MDSEVFTNIEQITPEWLTNCLRQRGVLPSGQVVTISGLQEETVLSVVGRMDVKYSQDAPSTAPKSLFLKTGVSEDAENEDWIGEVSFYKTIASSIPSVTVPCYDAAYVANPARFHILLDDFTSSHQRIKWPLPATQDQYLQMIDCLSDLHSAWWNHPRLGVDIQTRFTETKLDNWISVWEQQLAHFYDELGDRLLPGRKKLYEMVLHPLLARLLERRKSQTHYTIAHQDAHPYNFLFPNDTLNHTTSLVDWATWDMEVGARDLAYLIALHCFPEQRLSIERPLLQHYHNRLLEKGIADYSWEQLWEDYRLFVAWNLFVPVEQCFWKLPPSIWWLHAERSTLAFDDLQCMELFK